MNINIDEQIIPPTQLSFSEAIQVDNLFIEGKLTHLELGYVATPPTSISFPSYILPPLVYPSDVMKGRNNAFSFIKPLNRYEIYILIREIPCFPLLFSNIGMITRFSASSKTIKVFWIFICTLWKQNTLLFCCMKFDVKNDFGGGRVRTTYSVVALRVNGSGWI